MKCDIFIRTYDKDSAWLTYCIKSIEKHANGFNDLVITYPENNKDCFYSRAKNFTIKEIHNDGYIDQQLTKLLANNYVSSETTHILYVDSDCCFYDKFSPQTYMWNDVPVICMTPYNKLITEVAYCWKKITENILNVSVEYEFMRRLPLLFNKKSIENLQTWILNNKKITIENFIKNIKNREFSEFNLLGAFSYYIDNKVDYKFLNTDKDIIPHSPCKQYWSWGGMNSIIKKELDDFII